MTKRDIIEVYVFPTNGGRYFAAHCGSRGTAIHGATRKTKQSAKQSFTQLAKELKMPRDAWVFYRAVVA